ncbi:MAG: glycoside hydrolase family 31 protein, partial [Balneolaceae bacterium]|nr:glycoside hydrolase family 31 protein [Balneolaceae bacterium]
MTVTLLVALGTFWGCRAQLDANDWYVETATEPLSFSLTQSVGDAGPLLTGEEASALFFITGRDTQYVLGPVEIASDDEGRYDALHATTDGREASVLLERGRAGTMELRFTVAPDSGIDRKGITIASEEGEAYYGLMERVVDGHQDRSWEPGIEEALDLRGQQLTMYVKPTLSIYEPFYLTSQGYGVFVEGTWPGSYDMAASNPDRITLSFEGPELTVRFIQGPEPAQVVERFHEVIGRPFLPPRWAFSVYHWRDDHSHRDTLYDGTGHTGPYNSMLTEDMLMLEALDIPFGVYWVDRPWATGPYGYDDFEWDPERFPRAEEMLDWIHRKDKRFLLWIAPWVMGDMLTEAEKRGFLIPGSRYRNENNPDDVRQLLDFSNPDAVEWWGDYLGSVIDDGVDAFKLDRSEELMPDSRDVELYNGNSAREEHNNYPLLYIRETFLQAEEHRGDRNFLLMPRAAYTGSQRYGAFWG